MPSGQRAFQPLHNPFVCAMDGTWILDYRSFITATNAGDIVCHYDKDQVKKVSTGDTLPGSTALSGNAFYKQWGVSLNTVLATNWDYVILGGITNVNKTNTLRITKDQTIGLGPDPGYATSIGFGNLGGCGVIGHALTNAATTAGTVRAFITPWRA